MSDSNLSASHTVRYQLSQMKRVARESDASFARRMYYMQMEVYSAYAGGDLAKPFEDLSQVVQASWLAAARKHNNLAPSHE